MHTLLYLILQRKLGSTSCQADALGMASSARLADLSMANAAAVLEWTVQVVQPRLVQVQYEYQGRTVSYEKFTCLLTTGLPGDYVRADLKGTRADPQAAAKAGVKFVADTVWTMKQPKILTDVKSQYVSAPIKHVIDLAATNLELTSNAHLGQAIPKLTVSEIAELSPACAFDLKAWITSCSALRNVGQTRQVLDVTLEDGSEHEGKQASLTVAIFNDKGHSNFAFLQDLSSAGAVVLFYGLQGKKTDKGFVVSNSRDFLCTKAPAAVTMPQSWENVQATVDKFTMASGYEVDHDMDYTAEAAFQTCVCVLDKCLVFSSFSFRFVTANTFKFLILFSFSASKPFQTAVRNTETN